MFFGLRFDFRNPDLGGVSTADRYAAALEMVEWADRLGGMTVAVSEHHGSDDGYLPSPLVMLSAMAARTTNVRHNYQPGKYQEENHYWHKQELHP